MFSVCAMAMMARTIAPSSAAPQVVDEALVDLDHVHREAPQIIERGVTAAEIADRDAHAELLELAQHGLAILVLVDQDALGDFQFDVATRHPGLAQDGLEALHDIPLIELARR